MRAAPAASRSAWALSAKTAWTPTQTGAGSEVRRRWPTVAIIVRAVEMMSSISTGVRSSQRVTSGGDTSTSRSPRRVFSRIRYGASQRSATAATHCSLSASGPHGLTELVYAYTSQAHNNGSAFGGITGDTLLYNITGGVTMLIGRFALIIAALAIAGSLVRKRVVPTTAGTLRTDTPLFTGLLIVVTIIVTGLTYFPVLALGPLAEHFTGGF